MAKRPAQGQATAEGVHVADAAQAAGLGGNGALGTLDGAGLHLSLVEAAWAMGQGRLAVTHRGRALDAAGLLGLAAPGAETAYLAYADLRERGLAVRHEGRLLSVGGRGKASAGEAFRLRAVSDLHPLQADQVLADAEAGTVLAVVDGDGAVTHYRVRPELPAGTCPERDLPRAEARLLSGLAVVPGAAAAEVHERERLGTPTAAGLVLSFLEAAALRRRGVLSGLDGLEDAARRAQPRFDLLLAAYQQLRGAGVVVRSGLKFGTDLRGYRGDPDASHAEWLIQCAAAEESLPWGVLARGVRLAHGVRKTFLLAVVGETVRFAAISWFKP